MSLGRLDGIVDGRLDGIKVFHVVVELIVDNFAAADVSITAYETTGSRACV